MRGVRRNAGGVEADNVGAGPVITRWVLLDRCGGEGDSRDRGETIFPAGGGGGIRRVSGDSTDWESGAGNSLDVVAAHVEIGHSVYSSEFDGCYVVRLRCFFLST